MSQEVVNQVADRLNGTPKKFTIYVHLKAGTVLEFQSDEEARAAYDPEWREPIIRFGYSSGTTLRALEVVGFHSVKNAGT